MMKKLSALFFQTLLALCLISAFSLLQAQEETDNIAVVWSISAVDGKDAEFEAAVKGFHEFMADKEGHWGWQWYSVLTGPDTGKYLARSGNHNWEDMDAEHDYDDEVTAYFGENVAPFVESATRSITEGEDEVIHWPESMDEYNFFQVTDWQIKQGQGDAFYLGLQKIHAALQEGGWGGYYAFAYNATGGRSGSMILVTPYKNWADMKQEAPGFLSVVNEVLGEEEAEAILDAFNETYRAGDVRTLRLRKDMNPGY